MNNRLLAVLAAALLAFTPLAGWAQAKWRIAAADKPDGAGPWPLVMLIHGCGGIQGNIAMWRGVLGAAGYATIVVDGFSERGVQEICTDFRRVPATERVTDAFEALSSLKADPALDTSRAAIMGFSNGAVVAFDAANERTLRGYKYAPRFRASIALYPECKMRAGTQFGIPLLIGIGAADDWTLASSCQEVFDYSKGRAEPDTHVPRLEIYADAHHAFDTPGLAPTYRSQVRNTNSSTGYGATTAGHPEATTKAIADVLEFLRRELK